MARGRKEPRNSSTIRIGQAAEMLAVSPDTLRRWESAGKIRVQRSKGGQRLVSLAELRRLQTERRDMRRERPRVVQSARNRFPGLVTRVEKDRVAAVVEVQSGPHRLVSLMTAEAATDLALRPGVAVVCVVKATNVVVEVPARR